MYNFAKASAYLIFIYIKDKEKDYLVISLSLLVFDSVETLKKIVVPSGLSILNIFFDPKNKLCIEHFKTVALKYVIYKLTKTVNFVFSNIYVVWALFMLEI